MIARTDPMDSAQTRFSALLDQHRGIVLKVAASYCRDSHDRQDLAQEITLQLWRAFPQFDQARSFSTWMYRIALNVAISHLRGSVRGERTSALDDVPETHSALHVDDHTTQLAEDQPLRTLYAVINRQSGLDRALLLLWLEDRSQREIADILGISESNVATKLSRLKERIREQFNNPNPSPSPSPSLDPSPNPSPISKGARA